jgi:hypothetical protein
MLRPPASGTTPQGANGHPPGRAYAPARASASKGKEQHIVASRKNSSNTFWPTFGNRADAQQAMKGGAAASWVVAAINLGIGLFLIFSPPGTGASYGMSGAMVIDGTIFALVGWGIWRYSLIGAIAGFAFFSLEKIYQFSTQPKAAFGIFLAVVLWMAFLNGVRGALALRQFERAAAPVAADPEAP